MEKHDIINDIIVNKNGIYLTEYRYINNIPIWLEGNFKGTFFDDENHSLVISILNIISEILTMNNLKPLITEEDIINQQKFLLLEGLFGGEPPYSNFEYILTKQYKLEYIPQWFFEIINKFNEMSGYKK